MSKHNLSLPSAPLKDILNDSSDRISQILHVPSADGTTHILGLSETGSLFKLAYSEELNQPIWIMIVENCSIYY